MSKALIIILTLFSSVSFAQQEIKLTNEEFLSRLSKDEIIMRKDPLFALSQPDKEKVLANFKKNYPGFKDAYWFVPNLKTNKYLYTVFYEWPNHRCLLRVEELDTATRKVKPEGIDPKGQVVDIKHCEKAYGIKITID